MIALLTSSVALLISIQEVLHQFPRNLQGETLQLIWSRVVGMDTNSLQIVPSVHGSTIDLSACPCIIPWCVSRCHNSDANVSMYAGMLAYIQCCLVAQCTSAVQQSFLCNRYCRALLNATSLTSTSNQQNLIVRLT
jgi:hypothetical protein